jgi:hypothetical protein
LTLYFHQFFHQPVNGRNLFLSSSRLKAIALHSLAKQKSVRPTNGLASFANKARKLAPALLSSSRSPKPLAPGMSQERRQIATKSINELAKARQGFRRLRRLRCEQLLEVVAWYCSFEPHAGFHARKPHDTTMNMFAPVSKYDDILSNLEQSGTAE